MKKVTAILILFTLISCKEVLDKASKLSTEELTTEDFKTITVQNLYKLSVPKYMKEMNNLNDEASLQYANIYKEAYAIVIHESKQEFIDSFKEYGEYDNELSMIDNYTNAQINFFKEGADIKSVEKSDGIEMVNGANARRVIMKGNAEGIDVGYVLGFVEGEENIYMIMNWTLLDRFSKYENTFEMINASFNLVK